jgi:hypothetical protein
MLGMAHDLHMHQMQPVLLLQKGGQNSMLEVHVPLVWLLLLWQAIYTRLPRGPCGVVQPCQLFIGPRSAM